MSHCRRLVVAGYSVLTMGIAPEKLDDAVRITFGIVTDDANFNCHFPKMMTPWALVRNITELLAAQLDGCLGETSRPTASPASVFQ